MYIVRVQEVAVEWCRRVVVVHAVQEGESPYVSALFQGLDLVFVQVSFGEVYNLGGPSLDGVE